MHGWTFQKGILAAVPVEHSVYMIRTRKARLSAIMDFVVWVPVHEPAIAGVTAFARWAATISPVLGGNSPRVTGHRHRLAHVVPLADVVIGTMRLEAGHQRHEGAGVSARSILKGERGTQP